MEVKHGKVTFVSIPQWCDCCEAEIFAILSKYDGFNPTMVRLLHLLHPNYSTARRCFNPTMVRLLRMSGGKEFTVRVRFNPTMVRLLPLGGFGTASSSKRFNPTMVRLLPRQNFGFWGQNEAK